MYCPNCGSKNSEGQNFCRSCGLGLEKVALTVAEQLPTVSVKSLKKRQERLEVLGVASLSIFGVGVVGFLLYSLFSKLLLTQGPLIALLGVIGAAIFIGSGLASVILFTKARELKEASSRRQIDSPLGSGASMTGKLLDQHEQPEFSIADRTTNLLPTETEKKSAID